MTLDGLLGALLFDQLNGLEAAHAAIPVRQTSGLLCEGFVHGRWFFLNQPGVHS
jgi:hypothetical protein